MARGSITPRPMKDGKVRYRIKWESRDPHGKRVYHSETLATKKEAERFLADKLKEVNDGTFVQPTDETVKQFLERWVHATAPRVSEGSAYKYRSCIRRRINPFIGDRPLQRLNELIIQELYSTLTAKGYAPRTVLEVHTILDTALSQAVAWRILRYSPTDGVRPPTAQEPAPAVWSADEAEAFLALAEACSDRYAPIWRLGLDSGMRLGELLALTWQDVDFQRGVVSIRRTLTRNSKGGWRLGEHPKTSKSRRSIALAAETLAALRRHKARQAERRLAAGPTWTDLDLVFDRGDGSWFNPSTVQGAFATAVVRAKVPRLTPHGMRHTMATLMLVAGIHPKIVQERLGHNSIQMTLDRYSHVTATMQQDAAATLEEMMNQARERRLEKQARPKRGHGTDQTA